MTLRATDWARRARRLAQINHSRRLAGRRPIAHLRSQVESGARRSHRDLISYANFILGGPWSPTEIGISE